MEAANMLTLAKLSDAVAGGAVAIRAITRLDPAGGPASAAHIFVAVLGASNYTYACATPAEGTADWIRGLVGAQLLPGERGVGEEV